MIVSPPCVSVELSGPPAALYSVAVLEARCDAILGKGRCRVVTPGPSPPDAATCWNAAVVSTGAGPSAATIVLRDPEHDDAPGVQHAVEFRPHDAPADRWATLGLLIAALVTIEQHSSEATEAERASPAGAAPPSSVPTVVAVPRPSAAAAAPLDWDLRASGLLAVGVLPGVAWGVRVEADAGRGVFAGLARLSYLPERARTLADMTKGGDFQQWAAGLGACARGARDRRVSLGLCAGFDGSLTLARGFGLAEPASPSAWSGAAWTGASARWRLHRHAAVIAALEGAADVLRPRFQIEGASALYAPPTFSARATLGLAASY